MSTPSSRWSSPTSSFALRFKKIREKINAAAEKVKFPSASILVVAVTKNVSPDRINEAAAEGLFDFGENKVQEAAAKRSFITLPQPLTPFLQYHMVGHLQTNKARKAVELFDLIQSVDSPKLAALLDRYAGDLGKKQRCLIEVKVSSEVTKTGVPISEAEDFIKSFGVYQNLELEGLMTIGPMGVPAGTTRQSFREVAKLFKRNKATFVNHAVLSMGMSDDFEIAIEEGANMLRIGRALFGERT